MEYPRYRRIPSSPLMYETFEMPSAVLPKPLSSVTRPSCPLSVPMSTAVSSSVPTWVGRVSSSSPYRITASGIKFLSKPLFV